MKTGLSPRRRGWRGGAVLIVCGILVAATTACHVSGVQVAAPCTQMSPTAQSSGQKVGRTAVLVDVSDSTRSADSDIGAPDYDSAVQQAVDDAVGRQDDVSIGSFSGSQQVDWTAVDDSTAWTANPDPPNQQALQGQADGCLLADVERASEAAPTSSGTYILGAIRSAAGWLAQATGSKHLIVATDGLETEGCANLTSSTFEDSIEIDAIAQDCAAGHGDITSAELSGVDVTLVGIGQPAPGQPTLTTPQQVWLTQLWQKLCTSAHAVSDSGTCTVQQFVSQRTLPATMATAGGADGDPIVDFGDGREIRYWDSAAALFATNSPVVQGAAIPDLVRIAVAIRTSGRTDVVVYGYVDPTGSAANNVVLAQSRADAVKSVLEQYDSSLKVVAYGRGTPSPDSCPYRLPANANKLQVYQCERRVDILVSGKEGT